MHFIFITLTLYLKEVNGRDRERNKPEKVTIQLSFLFSSCMPINTNELNFWCNKC